jgi:hypothetical protein
VDTGGRWVIWAQGRTKGDVGRDKEERRRPEQGVGVGKREGMRQGERVGVSIGGCGWVIRVRTRVGALALAEVWVRASARMCARLRGSGRG